MSSNRALRSILVVATLAASAGLSAGCAAVRGAAVFDLDKELEPAPERLWPRQEWSAEIDEQFSRAQRLVGLARYGEAVELLRAIVAREPEHLEAHRLIQDVLIGSTSDWWLRRTYRDLVESSGGSANALYLSARLAPDWSDQERLFSEALARDPSHPYARIGVALARQREGDVLGAVQEARRAAQAAPWLSVPWLFLGHLASTRGDLKLARHFYHEAQERAPEDARPWLGLARAAWQERLVGQAGAAAVEALRRAPGDAPVVLAVTDLLDEARDPGQMHAAIAIADAALPEAGDPALLELLRGRLLADDGPADAALSALRRAVDLGVARAEVAPYARTVLVREGRYAEAVDTSLDALPPDVRAADNLLEGRWRRLVADTRSPPGRDGAALLRIAADMRAVGWLDEARVVAGVAASTDVRGQALAFLAEESAFSAFLGDLEAIGRSLQTEGRREAGGPDLEEALARVRAASLDRLGRDVTEGAVERSYPLLGAFVLSVASGGALEREFSDRGLFLLVGKRAGGAPELAAGRMVLVRSDRREEVLGQELDFDECWIESSGLPAQLSGLRAGLAGLTLDRFVLLQLDAVRRTSRATDSALPFERRPAATRADLVALDTPSRVAFRLERSLAQRGRLDAGLLDAVRRHELVHVHDARRLLPLHLHPGAALAFGLKTGFAARSAERLLEARAAALSIAECAEPRAALASLTAFLPDRDGGSAHPSAYLEVLERAVAILADELEDYPSLEPGWNLVQQLDRLTDDEIRRLGRRVAETF